MWLRPDAIQGASGGAGYRRGASWGCHRGTCKRPAGAVGCVYARRSRLKKRHTGTHRHTYTQGHTQTHTHRDTHTAPAASSGHAGVGWGGEAQTIFDTSRMLFHFLYQSSSRTNRFTHYRTICTPSRAISHISFSRSRRCLHGHGHFHIIPFLLPHL